ncbi:hypothetical protein [Pedobacter rhizosphaerae]|uniref:Uncharacterized protein n=1 Tax=Pedobacter rhizosphaerae TaxID=390241 RepID=A0A1H9JXP9_9SPHI|nr:hypothetical protein [Pedobacter rhizosphaerae]SEQ91597.1 hypothetical protein SAMN04488023_102126 [Pedobacter rhizosphaerae]
MQIKKIMKFQSKKGVKPLIFFLFFAFILSLSSCKKDGKEVIIDAFAQLNPEVKHNQGVYNIQFTLQQYPYQEVIVRLAESKTQLFQNSKLVIIQANQMSLNRYGVFINNLIGNKNYYYQILVKDSATSKEVYSDVFSFSTNP